MEFSKKLLFLLLGIQIFTIVSSFILMLLCRTTDGIEFLIPSVSAELSVAVGFYYWKAKAENLLKIRRIMQKYDMNTEPIDEAIEDETRSTYGKSEEE